jgi:hypothetical protein
VGWKAGNSTPTGEAWPFFDALWEVATALAEAGFLASSGKPYGAAASVLTDFEPWALSADHSQEKERD